MKQTNEKKASGKITSKQIAAWTGIVLLLSMYLLALFTAVFDTSNSMVFFRAAVIATFAIPLLIWIYIWMYGRLTGKHTMADPEIPGTPESDKET